jgi:hypothetical protein
MLLFHVYIIYMVIIYFFNNIRRLDVTVLSVIRSCKTYRLLCGVWITIYFLCFLYQLLQYRLLYMDSKKLNFPHSILVWRRRDSERQESDWWHSGAVPDRMTRTLGMWRTHNGPAACISVGSLDRRTSITFWLSNDSTVTLGFLFRLCTH